MKENDIIELDLKQLMLALWKKAWLLVLSAVLCGLIAFFVTKFAITPMYSADVKLYVNNSSISLGSTSVSISGSDLSTAQSLVSTYIVILQSRTVLNEIIAEGNLPYTTTQLTSMISASAMNSTEIFKITVINPDPVMAETIANIIAEVLPNKIATIVDGSAVRIVDYAIEPATPYSPDYTQNTLLGVLVGFVLSAAFVVLVTIFDESITSEDILTQEFDIPVLSIIPEVSGSRSGDKYGNSYYAKSNYYGKTSSSDDSSKGGNK